MPSTPAGILFQLFLVAAANAYNYYTDPQPNMPANQPETVNFKIEDRLPSSAFPVASKQTTSDICLVSAESSFDSDALYHIDAAAQSIHTYLAQTGIISEELVDDYLSSMDHVDEDDYALAISLLKLSHLKNSYAPGTSEGLQFLAQTPTHVASVAEAYAEQVMVLKNILNEHMSEDLMYAVGADANYLQSIASEHTEFLQRLVPIQEPVACMRGGYDAQMVLAVN